MKKTITIFAMLFIATIYGQDRDYQIFMGYSQDMKMAFEGPHGNGGTYNAEYKIGVELKNWRIGDYVEIHPDIGYTKWTLLAIDYKIPDFPFDNMGLYFGLETSTIYRKRADKFAKSSNIFNPGANIELQYRLYKTLYLGVGYNVFRAEQILIDDGKEVRTDVMLSAYFKF